MRRCHDTVGKPFKVKTQTGLGERARLVLFLEMLAIVTVWTLPNWVRLHKHEILLDSR